MFCSRCPSRFSVNMNGVCAPASVETLPALKAGLNPPEHPLTSNVADGEAEGVGGQLHGVIRPVVVAVPHGCGSANGARGPPFISITRSLTGNCGVPSKTDVMRPVEGLTIALPASLTTTPSFGVCSSR